MKKNPVIPLPYPSISWKAQTLEDDIRALTDYAIAIGQNSKGYYTRNSAYKRAWAKALRLIAILATAVAGLLPIISQIASKYYRNPLDPAWATIAISVGITAIGLDRFFGFSSAWMRFVTTEIKIEGKIGQFRMNIENEKFSWAGEPPSFDKAKTTLNIIAVFINDLSDTVKDETNSWMLEFQNVIQKLNEDANVKVESSKLGGLSIAIENGDKFPDGITILLEGQAPVHVVGSSYVFNNLFPKIYRLSIDGLLSQKPEGQPEKKAHAEALVNITPGNITNAAVSLK